MNVKHFWNKTECIITDKSIVNILMKCGRYQHERFIPSEYLNLPKEKLSCLFETLMLGDGNKKMTTYYTTSLQLRDNIIELGLKLGYSISISEDKRRNNGKWRIGFRVNLSKKAGYVKTSNIKQIKYKGKVWCIQTKNHNFLIEKNGKLSFTGNSIAWDPYQSGGLGTPEHQRVSAGDVHRAHLGVLFIDEVKNLTGAEAITLLTVLEDGQLPIALRSLFHGGDTAAMAVSTEPVPAMFFFIGAGNLDSLPQMHKALVDRIAGYGRIVYMNNDMPNTVENRRKYVQFIAQETKRFNLLPFSREACKAVIDIARIKSGRNDRLTCQFRPMISIIKVASILAQNDGKLFVDKKYVDEAFSVHCKSIAKQILEKRLLKDQLYKIIDANSKPKIGQIYGLAVSMIQEEDEDEYTEMLGSVLPIRASVVKCKKKKSGSFIVTGVATEQSSWMQHSIAKVRHVILQMFNVDISQDFHTHVDFAQEIGVDGPSAGVAMTLAVISSLKNKKIKQDVAVTGEINIGVDNKIIVTPIGGTNEKIFAAQKMGFKKVCIPKKNYEHDVIPSDYTIKIVPCETIEDYMKECFD
jgi:Lon-like ATP-dependent protease